jgi:hypothetical protein
LLLCYIYIRARYFGTGRPSIVFPLLGKSTAVYRLTDFCSVNDTTRSYGVHHFLVCGARTSIWLSHFNQSSLCCISASELPLTVTGKVPAKTDLQLTIDYTSTRLLQAVVVPEVNRRAIDFDLSCDSSISYWMARKRRGHIFGRSNRLYIGNSPIGSIIAAGLPSEHLRTRHIIYHAHEFASMVGFGAGSDHCSGLLGLSSCHANPTTWHSVQDNQCEQTTWRPAGFTELHIQN